MPQRRCPSAQQLALLVHGELQDPLADEIAEHLAECDSCVHLLEVLPADDSFSSSVRQAAHQAVPLPEALRRIQDKLASLPVRVATISGSADCTQVPQLPAVDGFHDFRRLLTPPTAPKELGSLGPYRILKLLGQGGMGVVLLAEDASLGRKFALKLMRPEYASHPEVAARFQREARATAAVRSDHVVSIFAIGEVQTPMGLIPYMAMECLRGESLERRLKRGPFSIEEVLHLSRQIATGLAAVHAKALVHRDIKPGNLWLEKLKPSSAADSATNTVRAKLLDFGLAHTGESATVLTQFGALVGTPAYMSPEQASGQEVDARSDLFSLGAVMYEMVTLQQPFRGSNTMAILMSLARDIPADPSTLVPVIPARLSRFIMSLLMKDAALRPPTALDVIQELRAIKSELRQPPSDSEARDSTATANSDSCDGSAAVADSTSDLMPPDLSRPSPENEHANDSNLTQTLPTSLRRVSPLTGRSRHILAIVGIILGLIGLGAGLNSLRVRVDTARGTLLIETDDENVELRVTRNGATILDRTKDRELQLEVGDYGIELVNKRNGLKLSAEKFTISRPGQPPIRITVEKTVAMNESPRPPESKTGLNQGPPVASDDASRRFAAWVHSLEGLVLPPGGGEPIKSASSLPIGAIPNIVSFNLSGTSQKSLSDGDVDGFKDFPGVENAIYIRLSPLTATGLMRIGELIKGKRIGQLGLLDMPIGGSAFKNPGGFADVVSLNLQNVELKNEELAHLKNLTKLRTLGLTYNNITDQGLTHLAEIKTLRHVNLKHTNVTGAGIAKLLAALPDCEIETSLPKTPPMASKAKAEGEGSWRIENETLVCQSPGAGYQVRFGEAEWNDLDFQVECLQEEGRGDVFLYYHCVDKQNTRQITLGSFGNGYLGADLWTNGVWSGLAGVPWAMPQKEWVSVRIRVRGDRADVFINDQARLTGATGTHPRGGVGVGIGAGRARFRNFKVTAPDGKVLWEGLPAPMAATEGKSPAQ